MHFLLILGSEFILDVVIFYLSRSLYSIIRYLACLQAHSASSGDENGRKLEILVKLACHYKNIIPVYSLAQATGLTFRCESLSKPVQTQGQLSCLQLIASFAFDYALTCDSGALITYYRFSN